MVNTFLPFASFEASVRCLDNKRLGKQRVEAYQIWRLVSGAAPASQRGWRNHPATRAWEGHADALAMYTNACIDEWTRRGFTNNMARLPVASSAPPALPWWVGFAPLHFSHRASLLRKDPAHYAAAFAAAAAAEVADGGPAAAAAAALPDAGDADALASFVPLAYRSLGYVWPASVSAALRAQTDAPPAALCAPIQAPPRGKAKKRARAAAAEADAEAEVEEEEVVLEAAATPAAAASTPRAARAAARAARALGARSMATAAATRGDA